MPVEFLVTLTVEGRKIYDGQYSIIVKAYEFEVKDGDLVFNPRQGGRYVQAYAKGQWAHVCSND